MKPVSLAIAYQIRHLIQEVGQKNSGARKQSSEEVLGIRENNTVQFDVVAFKQLQHQFGPVQSTIWITCIKAAYMLTKMLVGSCCLRHRNLHMEPPARIVLFWNSLSNA